MSIKVLPTEISNQIAAGEVVERPASVIKECVENSLDAKAQNIEIYLNNGGKTLIRVEDDGVGMNKDDLPKSVLRHATSKISTTDDLFHLQQYGFRGEALAAVSSISDFRLLSRTADSADAYVLTGKAGTFTDIITEAGNTGTTVEITNLFGPTPARLEYLKSDEAEYRACLKEIYGFALGQPQVSFRVFKNEKLTLDYPAATWEERITQVLKKLSTDLCPVELQNPNLRISGFVSTPGTGLSHRNQQYLLVNGRRIEDHKLAYAVREAYVQTCGIEKHLHPVFVLSLELDPILVDVNVHPRKLEVKFAEPGEIFAAVKHAVSDGLKKVSYGNAGVTDSFAERPTLAIAGGTAPSRSQVRAGNNFNTNLSTASLPCHGGQASFTERNNNLSFGRAPVGGANLQPETNGQPLTLIGQADNKYIVAQSAEGIYFFDQHALHERQRFEDFWQAYKAAPIKSQALLVPQNLRLTESEVSLLHEHKSTIKSIGFDIEYVADDEIVFKEVPEIINGKDLEDIIRLCIAFLQDEKLGENVLDQIMRKLLEYKACRGAVMFGDRLDRTEMQKLLTDFDKTDWKLLCPHGRPNHHFVPFAELDKKFHR